MKDKEKALAYIPLACTANIAFYYLPWNTAICGRYGREKITTFPLLSTQWPPNIYRGNYRGYVPSFPRGWGIGHQRITIKFVVDIVLDPVRYHPEFPSEQSECKQPALQHVHLFPHKSPSAVNTPISTSSWIFIFSVVENLDFSSPSECIRNVIACNSYCSRSGEEARWKNPA